MYRCILLELSKVVTIIQVAFDALVVAVVQVAFFGWMVAIIQLAFFAWMIASTLCASTSITFS